MTVNYTPLLGLAQPVTGTESGTWGDTINASLTALLETAIAGTKTADVTSGNWTLTDIDGADDTARAAVLIPTGTNGATTRSILAPNQSKLYVVINQATGSVVIKGVTGPTTGVTIASGKTTMVAWNGSDFVELTPTTASNLAGGGAGQIPYQSASGTTAMLAAGTSGQVLTSNGTSAPTWATASVGGTATGSSYTNPTAAGTAAAAFGSGASAASNYSTSIGDNSSAQGSVTATGAGAMALGGSYASGTDSFAAAIANNTSSYGATGYLGIAIGYHAKAPNDSIAIGQGTNAQGSGSMAIGPLGTSGATTQSIGNYSSAIGVGAYARCDYSVAIGYGADSNRVGKIAFGQGTYEGNGIQSFITNIKANTTTTTAIVLVPSTTTAISTTNSLGVADYGAISIQGTMIAKTQYASVMNLYTISGAAFRDASNNMVANSLTLTLVGTDNIGLGAAPTIGIDNTNKCIAITSGYKAATNIWWVATIVGNELKA